MQALNIRIALIQII